MMGKIACANVLSDLYAMGVMDCDNMLMLLAISTKMTEKERDVVIPLIMRGFKVRQYFPLSLLLLIMSSSFEKLVATSSFKVCFNEIPVLAVMLLIKDNQTWDA